MYMNYPVSLINEMGAILLHLYRYLLRALSAFHRAWHSVGKDSA